MSFTGIADTAGAPARSAEVPYAHLSVEVGHLYREDFAAGPERVRAAFRQAAPWLAAAREVAAAGVPGRPRVSTCFLVDDYFSDLAPPDRIVPMILDAARAEGVPIDYLARESACASTGDIDLAEAALDLLVEPADRGSLRPAAAEIGWLANGDPGRASAELFEAMTPAVWMPPRERAARGHSVFLDLELWSTTAGRRVWSCAYLAAVWQLLRLGLLRVRGRPPLTPEPYRGTPGDDWDAMPPVLQIDPAAAPFTAYRTFTIVGLRFLPTEHAVRTLLSRLLPGDAELGQSVRRAAREGITLPPVIADRLEYAFLRDPS
ncbi:SCO2522 family protein [Micromonospora tulbaghiae]|uniref:SCO2522 family protein n=1 Tax=Micromonospora tulbaghiae TaxID=479978 RepID=UPI0036C8070C